MNWYMTVLRKYAEFNGRARRTEFWMFFLINTIISWAISFVAGMLLGETGAMLSLVYSLAVLVPSIAVGVRRMHDTNRPGWWVIVPFINIYFACLEGTRGPNQYGPDPKAGG